MKLQSASKLHRRVAKLRPVVLALISAGCVSAAFAVDLPQDMTLKAGDAVVSKNASGTIMTATQISNRAVWESTDFSIAKGFKFENSALNGGLTLVRVVGNNFNGGIRSQIFGELTSTNHLILVNPFGISVGGSAVISTAALTMSAKDLSADLYSDGQYTGFMTKGAHIVFDTNGGRISGYGGYGTQIVYGDATIDISADAHITATADGGSIFLVADNVRNQGHLIAGSGGTVGLLAVPSAEFEVGDSGFITLSKYANYDPQAQDFTYRSAVNTGTIDAPNGNVILVGVGNTGEGPWFDASTADAPLFSSGYDGQYGSGAFNTGTITANGGKIKLIGQGPGSIAAVTGTLDVSAKDGIASLAGSISMTAETVRVGLYGAAPGQLFANGPNQDETGAVVGGTIDLGDTARLEGDGDATKTKWIYVSGDAPPFTGNADIPPLPTDGKASTLSASAKDVGNGGTITLSAMYVGPARPANPDVPSQAAPVARFDYGQVEAYGNFNARGGKNGGSGGNVVIAGQQINAELGDMRAHINVTPQALGLGENGKVSFVAPYMNIGYDSQGAYGGSFEHYEPLNGQSWINQDMITDLLTGGTDVSVTASGNGATAFSDRASLHVYSASIGSSGAGSSQLTLQSDGALKVDGGASIEASNGTLDLQLMANGGELSILGTPSVNEGTPVVISTNGGTLTLLGTQPAAGAVVKTDAGVHISGAVFNTMAAKDKPGDDKIVISGSGGGTAPGQIDTETKAVISSGTPSKHGVIIDGGSELTGTSISITGVSDSATGVSISQTKLNSDLFGTAIYGQSRGGFAASGAAIGVDIGQGVQINMGSGNTTIKGRAIASELSPDAVGVRIGQLELTTRPGQTAVQPLVTLIGVSVGSTAPGIQVTQQLTKQVAQVAQQTPQGISLHGEGTGLASTADVIIGASASYPTAQNALELGTPTWNTTGRINFKPMGLNDAMQATDAFATAIRVGANAGAVATNFIVKPEWFNGAANGNIPSEPGPSFVIGSTGQTGLISVADGALDGAGTVTLQNQGEGSEGIQLGQQQIQMQSLNLVTTGDITQTGPIMVNALRVISGPNSTVALDSAENQIGSISANNQPANAAPVGVAAAAPLSNASAAGILSYNSQTGQFEYLEISNRGIDTTPTLPVIPRPFEGPDALNDLRTDVYVHGQLSRPQICTAANTSGGATGPDGGAEPLALEWIKVRRSAQLSNCSGVRTDNSCSAF